MSDEINPRFRLTPFDVEAVADAYGKLAELARAGKALPVEVAFERTHHDAIDVVVRIRINAQNARDMQMSELNAIGVGLQGRKPR